MKSSLLSACETKHAARPLHGLRCQTTAGTDVWREARTHCVWRCLQMTACRYTNHNSDTGQCELGLGQCESLQQAAGFLVNAFGPPRHGCLLWGSRQKSGWVPIQERGEGLYLARIITSNMALVGKWSNAENVFIFCFLNENYSPDQATISHIIRLLSL